MVKYRGRREGEYKMKEQEVHDMFNWKQTYTVLPEKFYDRQKPVAVEAPDLVILNEDVVEEFGLDKEVLLSDAGVNILGGNVVAEQVETIAQAYAGHQFGGFTMLGDGRAILLGEYELPDGKTVDVQLKGAGRTMYSRGGDGRAAFGPMLREYIISEALHALGIPTTRSLAVVKTGEKIQREVPLDGAVLTRVAASHIRVGTFQYAQVYGELDDVKQLADYTIDRHFPDLSEVENPYELLLEKVIQNQATTIAKWQLVGFIHGVMNTDNMTISGETIDYGPCAFMDNFDPHTVFSSIDRDGRYAFKNQPPMGIWNLTRFAETLLPLLHEDEGKAIKVAERQLNLFGQHYYDVWVNGMRHKLGLQKEVEVDRDLIEGLLRFMHESKLDYTNTFIALTFDDFSNEAFESEVFQDWHEKWQERLALEEVSKEERRALMKQYNPAVIPRNYYVEEAIADGEVGNMENFHHFMEVLKEPYAHTAAQTEYAHLPPEADAPYQTFCGT